MQQPKCNHPDPNLCAQLHRHIHGHLWDIWLCKGRYELTCHEFRNRWISEAKKRSAAKNQKRHGRLLLFARQVFVFTKAVCKFVFHGLPTVNPADRAHRWSQCGPCKHRTPEGRCGVYCNCTVREDTIILNKVAWATEQCPLWKPEVPDEYWGPVRGETIWARAFRWLRTRFAF